MEQWNRLIHKKICVLECFTILTKNPLKLAEGVGFEPTVRLHVQRFSRPPRSTAPASLHFSVSNQFSVFRKNLRIFRITTFHPFFVSYPHRVVSSLGKILRSIVSMIFLENLRNSSPRMTQQRELRQNRMKPTFYK